MPSALFIYVYVHLPGVINGNWFFESELPAEQIKGAKRPLLWQ